MKAVKRAAVVLLAMVVWLLGSVTGAPPTFTPPLNATAEHVSRTCVPTYDILSLMATIQYSEENWLYTIEGNSIGEHMWWYALVGLSKATEPPPSRTILEETVRRLRKNGDIADEFEIFLEHETVQENSNARDFFRVLTFFCERSRVSQNEGSIETSLEWALWSLHDQFGGYIPPEDYTPPGNDLRLRHVSQREFDRVIFEFLGECTALLVITRFDSFGTADTIRNKLNGLPEACTQPDLILDLRDNAGGFLHEAIGVSDAFLAQGTIMYKVPRNLAGTTQYQYRATGEHVAVGEIAVLVNNTTASAAEIVAAALADNDRAELIGERTYGKGVGQTPLGLPNGGRVTITTFYVFTPTGKSFHNIGLVPSTSVPSTRTERVLGNITEKEEMLLERFNGDNGIRTAFKHLNSQDQ